MLKGIKRSDKYIKDMDLLIALTVKVIYEDADVVVFAVMVNYNSVKNFFNTSAVESIIERVSSINPNEIMVINSTILVGYMVSVREKFYTDNTYVQSGVFERVQSYV